MRSMVLVGLYVALAASCVQQASVQCGELTCPATWVCTPSGTSCVPEDAFTACDGEADGTACTAGGLSGQCRSSVCEVIVCGNRRIDPGEACDDGNVVGGDMCDATCRSDESCGNGVVDPSEGCDCGDGMTEARRNMSCESVNSSDPTATCRPDCTPHGCGDGFVEGIEQCETGLTLGKTCGDFGFYQGALACNDDTCQFDTMSCSETCMDGIPNGPELCDSAPPENDTCVTLGYDAGNLGCTSFCTPAFTSCLSIGWSDYTLDLDYEAVSGSSPNNVWFAGSGHMLRWDGSKWESFTLSTSGTIEGVWTASPTSAYAISGTKIYKFNGSAWPEHRTATASLNAISGSGDRVIAVGYNGVIETWNGSAWSVMPSGTTFPLTDVHVVSPTEAFAVGGDAVDGYVLLHWTGGASWDEITLPKMSRPGAVWASSADNLYVGGESLMHWNGTKWSAVQLGEAADVTDIHGSSAGNVVVSFAPTFNSSTSALARFDGAAWTYEAISGELDAVWTGGNAAVFTAGLHASRYHGSAWVSPRPAHPLTITAIAAQGAGRALAVGDRGYAIYFDGAFWRRVPGDFGAYLSAASGNIVVGDKGVLATFDGTRLTRRNSGTQLTLTAVWAFSDTNAYAVGQNGAVVHWNGTTGTVVFGGNLGFELKAIWAVAANNIWAVGEGGNIVRYDGSVWASFASGTTEGLNAIWASGPSDVWVAGFNGTVRQWNGGGWVLPNPALPSTAILTGIYGLGSGDLFVAQGTSSVQVLNRSAVTPTWSAYDVGEPVRVFGGSGTEMWAGGPALTLLQRQTNFVWRPELPKVELDLRTATIYVAGPADAYLHSSISRMYHFDGVFWSRFNPGAPASPSTIGGSGPTNVFVAGSGSPLARWDGATWTASALPASASISAVHGSSINPTWAVGSGGSIYQHNGVSWAASVSPTTFGLNDVWATSASDAWAVGNRVIQWNGTAWALKATTFPLGYYLLAVWAASVDDVFVAGRDGLVSRWDGSNWSEPIDGIDTHWADIQGATADDVFVAGQGGQIFHYDGDRWQPVRNPSSANIHTIGIAGSSVFFGGFNKPLSQLRRDVAW